VRNWGAIVKTLLFTVLVPGTVAGWIPWRLRGNLQATETFALRWTGILLIVIGVAIYLHTAFWGFAVRGNGTPAPIAPTKKLVVEGLHRYVRNPMYIGVALVVLGQAVLFRSWHILEYLAVIVLAAHLFVLFYEEPTLARRFGVRYEEYRRKVPRWIPRFGTPSSSQFTGEGP
jgi:protein-S-isoprenylcysteine O-methyltransferase Ste14